MYLKGSLFKQIFLADLNKKQNKRKKQTKNKENCVFKAESATYLTIDHIKHLYTTLLIFVNFVPREYAFENPVLPASPMLIKLETKA